MLMVAVLVVYRNVSLDALDVVVADNQIPKKQMPSSPSVSLTYRYHHLQVHTSMQFLTQQKKQMRRD